MENIMRLKVRIKNRIRWTRNRILYILPDTLLNKWLNRCKPIYTLPELVEYIAQQEITAEKMLSTLWLANGLSMLYTGMKAFDTSFINEGGQYLEDRLLEIFGNGTEIIHSGEQCERDCFLDFCFGAAQFLASDEIYGLTNQYINKNLICPTSADIFRAWHKFFKNR